MWQPSVSLAAESAHPSTACTKVAHSACASLNSFSLSSSAWAVLPASAFTLAATLDLSENRPKATKPTTSSIEIPSVSKTSTSAKPFDLLIRTRVDTKASFRDIRVPGCIFKKDAGRCFGRVHFGNHGIGESGNRILNSFGGVQRATNRVR